MANPFYTVQETIVALTRGRSRPRNDEFQAVEDGFDLVSQYAAQGLGTFAGDSTGSSNAYAVSMPYTRTSNTDGDEVVFIANHSSTGAATLNVDSIGAVTLVAPDGTAITAGDIESGLIYVCRYDDSNSRFQMLSPVGQDLGALAFLDTVDTAQIEDDAITAAKIDDGAVGTAALADSSITSAKMALDAGLTVAGGSVVMDSGEGLNLSANTGTSATGAATTKEILDFYEEGTWTPVLLDSSKDTGEGQAYLVQWGRFTRIGRVVFYEGQLTMDGLGSLSGSVSYIGGLPYAKAGSSHPAPANIATYADLLSIGSGSSLGGYVETGTSEILMTEEDGGATPSLLAISNWDTNSSISFAGFYTV